MTMTTKIIYYVIGVIYTVNEGKREVKVKLKCSDGILRKMIMEIVKKDMTESKLIAVVSKYFGVDKDQIIIPLTISNTLKGKP